MATGIRIHRGRWVVAFDGTALRGARNQVDDQPHLLAQANDLSGSWTWPGR